MYNTLDTFMGDFQPGLTVLDVLADMFAGDERSRSQTRQFANFLHRLTRRHNSGLLLLSHPSLTGLGTGTGTSGSTDNAFRARCYFKTPKTEQGTPINNNLRTFEGKKNNRGEVLVDLSTSNLKTAFTFPSILRAASISSHPTRRSMKPSWRF
jgi:RecA-family ATPase